MNVIFKLNLILQIQIYNSYYKTKNFKVQIKYTLGRCFVCKAKQLNELLIGQSLLLKV